MTRSLTQALVRALALLLVATPAALANPLDSFGFGARAIGLGGAYTAVVDDFSANYYNPAAVAASPDLRLELGYIYMDPQLTLNGADLGVDASRGIYGGVILPAELFGHRVGASVALYMPDSRITRLRSLPQRQPRFVLYDNRPQRIVISTSVAVQIIGDLHLGAGLTFLANTKGNLKVDGDVRLFDGDQTALLSAVDVNLESVRYATVGLLYKPGRWRFGVTFRDEFVLRLDMDVLVSGRIINDVDPDNIETLVEEGSFLLLSRNTNLFSPRQVAFGIAYQADRWLVAFDLTWLQWSAFPAPTAIVDVELDLGDLLDFAVPPNERPVAPNFHDIAVPRVGVEVEVLRTADVGVVLRTGYFFEPSPAPDQPGETNYIDADKHGLSFGLGLSLRNLEPTLSKPLEFDLAFQHIWMVERPYEKTDPADVIGDFVAGGRFIGFAATTKLVF